MDIFAPRRMRVMQIDGDYAKLISEEGIEDLVARALLPQNVQEGDVLLYQNLSYEILPE